MPNYGYSQDYTGIEDAYRRMEAIRNLLGIYQNYQSQGTRPNEMQQRGGQQQQGSSSSPLNQMQKMLQGSLPVQSGMTPAASNVYGEPFYGWGAQTGDWGANAAIPFDASQYGLGASDYAPEGMAGATDSSWLSSSGMGGLGAIAAIIGSQHLMSSNTDRRTDVSGVEGHGHRTGDAFSLDFFTEPWQPFMYEKFGVDTPSPGEKTDAAINAIKDGESGWDNLLRSAPATGAQWFDPFGSSFYDIASEKGGTAGGLIAKAAFPMQWLARLFD